MMQFPWVIVMQDYRSRLVRMAAGLLLGLILIVITGSLLKKILNAANSLVQSWVVLGSAAIAMLLLLALAEIQGMGDRDFGKLIPLDSIWVGIAQAFALIPGVSYSESTLTARLLLGMERETTAKLSLLIG